jgi:hypothetical protein
MRSCGRPPRQAAQAGRRFLVTQDLDFSDVRKYTPGTHHGLLLVRLPEPGRTALFERVATLFRTEVVNSWAGCMVTATPHTVRVRRPPSESPDPISWTS